MSLTIRLVDPWDEDEMDVLQQQYVEAQRAEVPDARVCSRAESETMLRRPPGPAFYDAFAAFDGDPTPDGMAGQVWATGSTTTTCTRHSCGRGCLRGTVVGVSARSWCATPRSTSVASGTAGRP